MLNHLKEKKDVGFFTSIAGLMNSCSVLDLDAFERNTKAEGIYSIAVVVWLVCCEIGCRCISKPDWNAIGPRNFAVCIGVVQMASEIIRIFWLYRQVMERYMVSWFSGYPTNKDNNIFFPAASIPIQFGFVCRYFIQRPPTSLQLKEFIMR